MKLDRSFLWKMGGGKQFFDLPSFSSWLRGESEVSPFPKD